MARLNEPPVSSDTLETLRRRFLRQNRDIARTNSTQSLKIRSLENECARLLSENLQLRSDVLRLESELKGSQAHRVAEHALQIKEKMESQLVEWGAMLAGLGHEPLPRNHSPRAVKKPRIERDSVGRARTSDWRRRETLSSMLDLEAAALQEGRLPPLWENKTYPRETLNQAEILALCSEAEESTDSPDLGPPPVSRYVDEDPVKFDLPTLTKMLKPAITESGSNSLEDTCKKPVLLPVSPAASPRTCNVLEDEPTKNERIERVEEAISIARETEPDSPTQAAKSILKRKIREEEKENAPMSKIPPIAAAICKIQAEKVANEQSKPINRPIKEPLHRIHKRDPRDKSSSTSQRKPLGAKSSNENLASPKKVGKAPADEKGGKPKAATKDDQYCKDHPKRQREPKKERPQVVEIPPPSSPEMVVTSVDIEPESLSAEPNLAVPDSPAEVHALREQMNETPPPVDISSKGETTRGNRRARAAVSYAEPNLRDKMRRPNTKEVYDAVAGEGKQGRRTSQCHKDDISSVPSSVARSGAQSATSSHKGSNDVRREINMMASPLVQKTTRASAMGDLPPTVTTERKKKESVAVSTDDEGETDTATEKPPAKGSNRRLEKIAAREAEVAQMFDSDESDVYKFSESSPITDAFSNETEPAPAPEEKSSGRTTKNGRQHRSRRLSSMAREDLQLETSSHSTGKPTAGSRKRASMAAVRSTKIGLVEDGPSFSSTDGDSSVSTVEGGDTTSATATRATSTRRRTMMT
ncbi:hypothetical protein F4808DRAFT_460732 [Astrocystis sublimbata]|nr:hypothetical protein F4808DRAFT_460732 [Astrocystis sublimbata]